MRIFLKVRRSLPISLVIVLSVLLLVPAGTTSLPVPEFASGAGLGLPLALFIPVVIAIALVYGLSAGDPQLEAVAARPLQIIDAAFSALVACATLAMYSLVWLAFGNAWSTYPLAAGRNATGYIGLALLARPLVGSRLAGLLPVAVAIGVAVIGSHADGTPRWWAWPLAEARDAFSWLAAFSLLLLGLAATLLARPRE